MKKAFKYFGIVWLIGIILFNAITFLIPNKVFGVTRFDKTTFWIAYALITVAFIAQLVTAYVFVKDDSAEKIFLRLPLLTTSYLTVIVSVVVGLIFMIFPVLPAWIGAIICLLIAGYFAIACVQAGAAAGIVEQVGQKVKEKTLFIFSVRSGYSPQSAPARRSSCPSCRFSKECPYAHTPKRQGVDE